MSRSKGFGNPLSKTLGKVIDKVAPEVLDSFLDVAHGPDKKKNGTSSSSARSTDWHTRVPAPPRSRRKH